MPAILPRSVIGTPEPPRTRRKLLRVGVLLAHEVGVDTPPAGRYRSDDPARVLDDARAAASFGVAVGKAWEYSYMLGRDGSIFEQAGEYIAAHCLNFNPDSLGVIWLNALGLPPTSAQIDSWWWLRHHLVETGQLTELHTVAPHYRYRSTSCCGVLAEPPGIAWKSPTGEGRLGNLIAALTQEPTPPEPHPPTPAPPPNEEDDDMAAERLKFIAVEGTGSQFLWRDGIDPIGLVNPAQRDLMLKLHGIDPADGITISAEQFAQLH